MTNDSFTFGGVDMFAEYGIRVLHYDVLLPELRRRKVTVPGRSGSHDYGARCYEDRFIKVECDTRIALTKEQVREMAYALSKKARLSFWDEPDKYYFGRIYDSSELEYIGSIGYEFEITFECDPFAYSYNQEVVRMQTASYFPEYAGTAPTPTVLTIKNIGSAAAQGIRIMIRTRKENT